MGQQKSAQVEKAIEKAYDSLTTQKEIITLSRHPNPTVRSAATLHRKLPDRELIRMFRHDPDFDVQTNAIMAINRRGIELYKGK